MGLQGVDPVFEIVFLPRSLPGQLARFSEWDHSSAELKRQRATEDEPARLDGSHMGHAPIREGVRHRFNGLPEAQRITEQRSDVLKENPGLGKVGHLAEVFSEIWRHFWSRTSPRN